MNSVSGDKKGRQKSWQGLILNPSPKRKDFNSWMLNVYVGNPLSFNSNLGRRLVVWPGKIGVRAAALCPLLKKTNFARR